MQLIDDETIGLIAMLINGLMVPRSMLLLGKAQDPYDLLRHKWNLFGWQSTEEIKESILASMPNNENSK